MKFRFELYEVVASFDVTDKGCYAEQRTAYWDQTAVFLIEAAQITPPVGFNLFVMQSVTGANILTVAKATFPFFLLLMGMLALITVWPEIVLWLPRFMN